ncbi:MAG: MgtC/SapB family protein [Acholeplasmataceae bacterium]|nr:MgtC/SapB family protein [Acholeplasmataceae bacterium]
MTYILDGNLGFMDYLMKMVVPLAMTFAIAGLVGLERQNVGKAAGISSHILVAMGASAVAIMQRLMFEYEISLVLSGVAMDPQAQRVIAQVVTGVGFVGAGVIIKDSSNVVKGITTASTIWSTAMLGLILGSGYLVLGTILGIFLVLFIALRDYSRGFSPFRPHHAKDFEDQD